MLGRSIVTLNSLGCPDFAVAQLNALPANFHRLAFYWEAASIMCFEEPPLPAPLRRRLLDEANQLHADALTAEFRALALDQAGDDVGARKVLEALPRRALTAQSANLLLKIDDQENSPGASRSRAPILALRTPRRTSLGIRGLGRGPRGPYPSLRPRHWSRAAFYFPDDPRVMAGAKAFLALHPDAALAKTIAAAGQRSRQLNSFVPTA